MGLCFYHHAGFLRQRLAREEEAKDNVTERELLRQQEARLLALAAVRFSELRTSGRMGQVSGNVLFLLACVHALTGAQGECQESLESVVLAGQLNRAMLARPEFDSLRDREWFRLIEQQCVV
jgi:hypothetical protein